MPDSRSHTYKARGLVVHKRPLGESDLIVSLFLEDGTKLDAVAKGARKPQSQLSARLEVLSEVEAHLAQGRSLDVVREARLLESNEVIRQNFDKQAYAAVIAEALYKTIRPEIPLPHAFDMTRVALGALRKSSASFACAIGAAHLLKLVAYLGVRPNLSTCVSCGAPVPLDNPLAVVHVSVSDGGLVCANCNAHLDTVSMNANSLGWARFLLQATFAQIIETPVPAGIDSQTLQFAHLWLKAHMGVSLKSVGFALAYAEMGRGTDAIRP